MRPRGFFVFEFLISKDNSNSYFNQLISYPKCREILAKIVYILTSPEQS